MFGRFMIIFAAVLVVLAAIGYWIKKREAGRNGEEKTPDQVLENVTNWGDTLNRARYQNQDGK